MRKFVLLVVLGLGAIASYAQTAAAPKIGYADVDYIFSQMPDAKQIDADLKSLQTQLKNQIDSKVQEFQKKLADYNAAIQANTMPDAVRANTERELQQLQQNIEKLQQDAQTNLQTKQTQLMDPVYKKVGKAIEDTAKENGFTFVLNQQIGGLDVILYGDEKMDISDLVLKKMGVTPKPAAATTPAQPKK
ncbi:OmpH family outer membrane protein [Ohtaekwangia koreensis]|uniref:Outer membrane protein n=1 Tax=Ohtaekwangia koreensis TaxID=688867 RepID=A0A1T5LIE5_9BACT|nr:OmpH family outer membrane protein [Ohtaekwangia koreensis]SKC75429.1 outer membrane protein [Ohtaekwangia koreensis]